MASWMEKLFFKEAGDPMPSAISGITDAGAMKCRVLFPLLACPNGYEPNTFDLSDPTELEYWLGILSDSNNLKQLVNKAVESEGDTDDAKSRGDAFSHAFSADLDRLRNDPAASGELGFSNILELREVYLRTFLFPDVYRSIKQSENEASLSVLPDLLAELDSLTEEARLLTLITGVMAANIFDWGSSACVDLYREGKIIEKYRMNCEKVQRPWRVDDFDLFKKSVLGSPYKKALLFVDNSGADIVLGMLPLARELISRGTEVVLVANSLPALNDVTALELPTIVTKAAKHCDIIRHAAAAGGVLVDDMANTPDSSKNNSSPVPLRVVESGSGSPCIDLRQVSSELAAAARGVDLVVLEGMGRALHTNFNARFCCDVLKLAMVKDTRFAEKLLNGKMFDCVCRFEATG